MYYTKFIFKSTNYGLQKKKAFARMEHCVREPGIPPDATVHLVTMEIDVVPQPIFTRAVVNGIFYWLSLMLSPMSSQTVADPGFLPGGTPILRGWGAPTYDFAKISQKLHEIERIWTRGGGGHASLLPPLNPPLAKVVQCTEMTSGTMG